MLPRLATLGLFLSISGCAKKEASIDTTAATAPQPNVVTFTARDFAFTTPDTIPGGLTTLVFKNEGPNLHHVQLFRLTEGKTVADLAEGMKTMKPTDPPPPWLLLAGGVGAPAIGGEVSAIVDLEPGNYAVLCMIDTPDRVPHFAKGMMKALTVSAAPAMAAAPPAADVTVTLKDYTFTFSTPLTAGHHVIKVDNAGTQPHEVVLVKLAPGKTAADMAKWAETYKGDFPGTPMGGTASVGPAMSQYAPVDLTPGDYLAICYAPDVKDGKSHVAHGMVQPFTIS
ncbi:MAG: hypothetical protein ABI877_00120 [Gemmatimonadaceae bacterium]